MVKAIFFDIDGTLVSFKTHRVPQSTLDALRQLREKGVKLFIASGRSPANIDFLQEQIPFRFDGYVLMNGQYCVDDGGRVLHKQAFPREAIARVLPFFEKHDIPCTFMEIDRFYMNWTGPRVEEMCRALGIATAVSAENAVADQRQALNNDIYQLDVYLRGDETELEEEFFRLIPEAKSARWCPWFMDVIPAEGGKPRGMEAICAAYGYDMADTMAFGDGGNDITMLRAAGIGVAMGNSTDEVKAAADYATDDIDADGVAKALRHFGLL